MGENEERVVPTSLRDAIEQGFARTDGMDEAALNAENNGGMAPGGVEGERMAQEAAAPAPEEMTAEAPVTEPQPAPVPEITGPAQEAPQPAAQQPSLVQYLMQELQAQRQQNAQLVAQMTQAQQTVAEQSQAAQGAMDTALSQPSVTIPVLDFSEMQYDDDETRARKMGEWQAAMVQSIRDEVSAQYAGQLRPLIEEQKRNERISAEKAARDTIQADSRFSDFAGMDGQIEKILGANHEFDGMDARKRYLLGGLIARGLNYNPTPSAEQIVEMVKSSPDAQRMLDSERARTVADRNAQIPTIQPSSGYATANAIPDESPKTKEDLFRRTEQILGRR